MICSNCGAENSTEGQFCSNCGKRLDGKKPCSNCKKLIESNAVYCTFCGERVDGKKICGNCGKEIEGEFCSYCGSNVKEKKKEEKKEKKLKFEIFSIISSSCLLLSIFLMFGLLFTLGTNTTAIEDGETLISVKRGFAFYLFEVYKNIKDASFIELLPHIIATVAISGALIVSLIMGIISAIKFVNAIVCKKSISINANFLATFICYAFAVISVYMCIPTKEIDYGMGEYILNITITGWPIFGLVASLVLGIMSITLNLIAKGKSAISAKLITKLSVCLVVCVLIVVSFFVTYSHNFIINTIESFLEDDNVSVTVASLGIRSVVQEIAETVKELKGWSGYNLSYVYNINYLVSVAFQFLLLITLLFVLKNMFSQENSHGASMALSALTFVFAIANLVLSIVAKNDLMTVIEVANTEGALVEVFITGAIVGLVLSAFVFISTISCQVMENIKKEIPNN